MEPYISQISLFGFNFAPREWAFCSGGTITITTNPSLYALLGTTYGGNGTSTFALPELRGRTSLHRGNGYNRGQMSGEENVVLNIAQSAAHSHTMVMSDNDAIDRSPEDNLLAAGNPIYTTNTTSNTTTLNINTLSSQGEGHAHNNMQPFQVINFCISLAGYFPPRS